MLNIKVHRGTHQIGGSITEIYTENTHIFVDFGQELSSASEEKTDGDMIRMMENAKCDAVLFTHYHGDHIGLLPHIPKRDVDGNVVKIAIGKVARRVLYNIHHTLIKDGRASAEEKAYHDSCLSILRDKERIIDLEAGKKIVIGDFEIVPLLVDHSAYDAFMFAIRAEDKVIIHTGDFRTHGRLGAGFFETLERRLSGVSVDVLITEGTMMNRLEEEVLTEEELQEKALKVLKRSENKYAFLLCSSTNVESLASFANAAMTLGRAFYVNYYVYEQILLYRETAGKRNDAFKFQKTYPFENMVRYNPKLKMTQPEFMRENGFLMLIGKTAAYERRMQPFLKDDPLLIYSMWKGYVNPKMDAYDAALGRLYHGWREDRREDLHTSGHATAEDICRMIITTKPKKAIVPIHTERPDAFRELDIGEFADKVIRLSDEGVMEV